MHERSEPAAAALCDQLGRHIVALCIHYHELADGSPVGPERVTHFSGVLVQNGGECAFLTAGHALRQFDTALDNGQISVTRARLVDSFCRSAPHEEPVPFEYVSSARAHVDVDGTGLDFGLVHIRPYFLPGILTQGVMPIDPKGWAEFEDEVFDHYYLVGIPSERVAVEGESDPSVSLGLTLLRLEPADAPPDIATPLPRLVARICDLGALDDIDGMSGGPIFGIMKGEPAQYRLAAIQSGWLRSQRLVFGCRLDVILATIERWSSEPDE